MYGGLNETPRPYWAPAGGSLVSELQKPPKSYKKECQEKNLPFGSMPVDFLSRHSAQLPERALLL
jgi:hypothetical protein